MEAEVGAGGLLERERETALIADVLAGAAGEHGSVLVIEGEGGIGKSALLDWAADRAERAGLDVLRATGRPLESEYAFGVVHQLLGRRLAEADPGEREQLLRGAAAGAAALLEGGAAPSQPFPVVNAVTWMLANASEARPLALLVDDCHVADAPSLRLLAYLAQRVGDLPIAVVMATRPPDPGPAAEVLPYVHAGEHSRSVRLAGLSPSAVGWLIAELGYPGAAPEFVHACAEVSGGNPFLLRELLYVLAERAIEATTEAVGQVRAVGPRAVAEAVYLALGETGPAGTDLARALAVAGPASPLPLLTALTGIDAGEAAAAASRLVDIGILALDDERLSFAHPILATAVHDDLPPLERSQAHARVAHLLHEAEERPDLLAPHLLGAPPVGEPWALDALRQAAAVALAAGEPAVAVQHLARALEEPEAASPDLLLKLAGAQGAAGDDRADATFERALASAGDDILAARALLARGTYLLGRGDYPGAAAALREGMDRCPEDEAALAAELRSTWAGAALWDADSGGEAVIEATDVLSGIDEPQGAAEWVILANVAATQNLKGGDYRRSRAAALAAWGDGRALEALGPDDPALYGITATLTNCDALDEALAVWNAILAEARERGLLAVTATASYGRGNVEYIRGNLDDALADLLFALEWQRKGWGMYAGGTYWTVARIHLDRGEVDQAARLLDLPAEQEAELARGVDFLGVIDARAAVANAQGRYADAAALAEQTRELAQALGWEVNVFSWRHAYVRATLGAGRDDEAKAIAADAVMHARRLGAPSYLAEALRTQALAEPGRALELLTEADTLVAESPRRLETANVAVELGLTLRHSGDEARARDVLRRGLDVATACGATALAGRAREGLLAAGARPRRQRTTGRASLTPAELRVARLVAEGHTNRKVAEALFVTIKAVEWHLRNLYPKLGIRSREQLPGALDG